VNTGHFRPQFGRAAADNAAPVPDRRRRRNRAYIGANSVVFPALIRTFRSLKSSE